MNASCLFSQKFHAWTSDLETSQEDDLAANSLFWHTFFPTWYGDRLLKKKKIKKNHSHIIMVGPVVPFGI